MDKENLEKIMNSNKLTMSEKMEAIKEEMKVLLRPCTYLELFEKLKVSKASKKSKDLYFGLYESALEELLEEKKKTLSIEEIDNVLQYFQDETNKTRKFIKETSDSLLSEEEIIEKSKELTEEDLNYKRLAVAVASGEATENQKKVFVNEGKKVDIIVAKESLNELDKYKKSISEELSKRIDKNSKNL